MAGRLYFVIPLLIFCAIQPVQQVTALPIFDSNPEHEPIPQDGSKPLNADPDINRGNFPNQENLIDEMFSAISKGNVSVVKGLIDAGVDLNHFSISNEQSPLLQAVIFEEVEIIRLLVQAGADIHFRDRFGNSILSLAILDKSYEVIKALLSAPGTDLNSDEAIESRLLFKAISRGDPDIIRLLVKANVNVDRPIVLGLTPLMIAARDQKDRIVLELLEAGADINAVDKFGNTILDRVSNPKIRSFIQNYRQVSSQKIET